MTQAFSTTYNKFFRWPEIDRRKSSKPVDRMAESLPEGDIWIVKKALSVASDGHEDLEKAQKSIKRMYRKRLWTTYHTSYCREMMPKDSDEKVSTSMENALLEQSGVLYNPKTQKIMPPLPTARRINGYVRPSMMYIPLTTYQHGIGRVGYNILRNPGVLMPKTKEDSGDEEESEDISDTDVKINSKRLVDDIINTQSFEPPKSSIEEDNKRIDRILKTVSYNHPKACTCCACKPIYKSA